MRPLHRTQQQKQASLRKKKKNGQSEGKAKEPAPWVALAQSDAQPSQPVKLKSYKSDHYPGTHRADDGDSYTEEGESLSGQARLDKVIGMMNDRASRYNRPESEVKPKATRTNRRANEDTSAVLTKLTDRRSESDEAVRCYSTDQETDSQVSIDEITAELRTRQLLVECQDEEADGARATIEHYRSLSRQATQHRSKGAMKMHDV